MAGFFYNAWKHGLEINEPVAQSVVLQAFCKF
jgi:hypothetical protein